MKDIQARGETSSTSKHEISNKFSIIALLVRITIADPDPTPTNIKADLDPQH